MMSRRLVAGERRRISLFLIQHVSISLVLVMISFFCFWNSILPIPNDFAFDDHLAVVRNLDVVDPNVSYGKLWLHDIWGKDMLAEDSHRSYRPLLITLFRCFVQTFGLNPQLLRLFSISCHGIATVLVFEFASLTFVSITLGIGSALLFATHPVHVEAVVAVVNMAESLSLIFGLLAYNVYLASSKALRSLQSPSQQRSVAIGHQAVPAASRTPSTSDDNLPRRLIYLLSHCVLVLLWGELFAVSVLFKETGIVFGGLVVATSMIALLSEARRVRVGATTASLREVILQWLPLHGLWILCSFLSVVFYFICRSALVDEMATSVGGFGEALVNSFSYKRLRQLFSNMGHFYLGDSQLIRKAENPFAFLHGQERALSLMYLHYRYFFQLLWPSELCAEYAYDCIPKVLNMEDHRALLGIGFYAAVVMLALAAFWHLLSSDMTSRRGPGSVDKQDAKVGADGGQPSALPPIDCSTAATAAAAIANASTMETAFPSATLTTAPPRPAFLLATAWLLIPFLPASGLFLRLGTLLAERLLYTPSVGFCMLASLALHAGCDLIAKTVCGEWCPAPLWGRKGAAPSVRDGWEGGQKRERRKERERESEREQHNVDGAAVVDSGTKDVGSMGTRVCAANTADIGPSTRSARSLAISLALYWVCIVTVATLYSLKTRAQSRVWRNDETLHLHGLTVCPRSAKLRSQLGKIALTKGDLAEARTHILAAKEIDPDFCDNDYQVALLQLFVEKDLHAAQQTLVQNLRCVYSSKQSFELLTKLWDEQLKEPGANNDHRLLAQQARLAFQGGLTSVATRKLRNASVLAFRLGDFASSLFYSALAERTVPYLLEEHVANVLQLSMTEHSALRAVMRLDKRASAVAGRREVEQVRGEVLRTLNDDCSVLRQEQHRQIGTEGMEGDSSFGKQEKAGEGTVEAWVEMCEASIDRILDWHEALRVVMDMLDDANYDEEDDDDDSNNEKLVDVVARGSYNEEIEEWIKEGKRRSDRQDDRDGTGKGMGGDVRANAARLFGLFARSLSLSDEQSTALVDLVCSVYADAAQLRLHLRGAESDLHASAVAPEVARLEYLLAAAAQPHCVTIDPRTGLLFSDHASPASKALQEILYGRVLDAEKEDVNERPSGYVYGFEYDDSDSGNYADDTADDEKPDDETADDEKPDDETADDEKPDDEDECDEYDDEGGYYNYDDDGFVGDESEDESVSPVLPSFRRIDALVSYARHCEVASSVLLRTMGLEEGAGWAHLMAQQQHPRLKVTSRIPQVLTLRREAGRSWREAGLALFQLRELEEAAQCFLRAAKTGNEWTFSEDLRCLNMLWFAQSVLAGLVQGIVAEEEKDDFLVTAISALFYVIDCPVRSGDKRATIIRIEELRKQAFWLLKKCISLKY